MIIHLTKTELMVAGLVGNMRTIASMGYTSDSKHSVDSQWVIDTDGAAAEMAFAKYLGVYYEPSVNTFKAPDVSNIQVRGTRLDQGKLIVRKRDPDNEIYVLVINKVPEFRIAGWIKGGDAQQDKYLFDPGKKALAWFVPQADLNKMEDLDVKAISTRGA